MNMAKVKVNQEVCIGCGQCTMICPDCFELNEDGKSQVKVEDCTCENVMEAKDDCPVKAISVEG